MPVLVTGAAGYIGSHVARELLGRGEQVLVLDLAASPPRALLAEPGMHYVSGDMRDRDLLDQLFGEHEIDAVMHFAALKSVAESMSHPGRYFDNNVGGSLTLLQAMAQAGVAHLVFSSSSSVYGEPERVPVDEDCRLQPANPYGESKLLIERMLPWFDRLAGIRSLSLRYFNAAGASDDGLLGERWEGAVNLIPVVMEAVLGRGPAVQIFGTDYPSPDGTAIRDYVHVLDLADVHLRALDHLRRGSGSEVVNVGTGVGSSVQEVITATEAITGSTVPTVVAPRRPGDPAALWADCTRSERLFRWKARRGLPEIIESAWRWHGRESDASPSATGHIDLAGST